MPLEVYYQKIPQYSEENKYVEVSFKQSCRPSVTFKPLTRVSYVYH